MRNQTKVDCNEERYEESISLGDIILILITLLDYF